MDDTQEDARYTPNPYGINSKEFSIQNVTYSQNVGNEYAEDDDNDIDDEDMEYEDDDEDDGEGNGVQRIGKDDYVDDGGDDDEEDDDYGNLQRHPKKRKLKSLSSYEFAPRVPAPSPVTPALSKPSYGGRNPLTDWTENETLILLDAWGERFLKHGRKSLRSEEWQEVSKKVCQESKIERTDTQCRNRLDTLKKKYKKEKIKLGDSGDSTSKWVYFKKMDMLLSSASQQAGLSCGLDSGEYTFMNPKVCLNSSNGLDEMRDSPGNSESTKGGEDESEGLPPKTKNGMGDGPSLKLLADSIQKFSNIYEKIENSKRQQMLELEKMRMDFHRDLELQKRQILERARAEIVKIRRGGDEDNDVSAENVSG